MNKILLVITALIFNTFLLTENDPFEEINRTTLKINESLDKAIATPVETGFLSIYWGFLDRF